MIWFCTSLAPRLLGIDSRSARRELEERLGIQREKAGISSAWRMFDLRAYRVDPRHAVVGLTVAQAEARTPNERLFIERIRRGDAISVATPEWVLQAGDVVAVSGKSEVILNLVDNRAVEVADRELLDIPNAMFDVVLSNPALVGKRLADIVAQAAEIRGVFLRDIRRGGESIPIGQNTVLERGDVLTLVGLEPAVERVIARVGRAARPSDTTDFVVLGLAIFAGAMAGVSLALPIGELHIVLGSSVGTLVAGLLAGWRNSVQPLFGRVPHGAIEFMKSIGLAGFVAMIGLKAGPMFVDALREVGVTVFLAGIAVTLVPQFVGLFVGRYLLKLDPILLLGGLSGAQTMTAALAAVQERSASPVAVLGYSGTVAFGHILITTWGTVIVWLLQ